MDNNVEADQNAAFVQNHPIGEHGPYYIMDAEMGLCEIPDYSVCRDKNYSLIAVCHSDIVNLAAGGWNASFESSALLHQDVALRSRAIVVLTNNGWMRGEATIYFWCIRFNFKTTNPNSSRLATPNEDDGKFPVKFGHRVLWPIPPQVARDTYDELKRYWSQHSSFGPTTSLIDCYKPHPNPFSILLLDNFLPVQECDLSTIRLLQLLKPSPTYSYDLRFEPEQAMNAFYQPADAERRHVSLFASKRVAKELFKRNAMIFPELLQFTASEERGFQLLPLDISGLIFERIAEECINTPGAEQSASFQSWLTLRRICKESKNVVEVATFRFMRSACRLLETSLTSLSVADAIAVRNELAHRAIVPHMLYAELMHSRTKKKNEQLMYTTIWPYARLRTNIPITRKIPEKAQLPASPPSLAPSPPVVPIRSSKRLELKREEREAKCSRVDAPFSRIRVLMRVASAGEGFVSPLMLPCQAPQPVPAGVLLPASPLHDQRSSRISSQPPTERRVRCSRCGKTRALPPLPDGLHDSLSSQDLPDRWVCAMSGVYVCEPSEDGQDAQAESAFVFQRVTRARTR